MAKGDALDRLCARLRTIAGIADWKVRHRVERQTQLYVIGDRPEATRVVDGDRFDVTVYVDHDGGRGASGVTLYQASPDEWRGRLEDAASRARLQANPRFDLPGPQRYRRIPLVDDAMRERPAERARDVFAALQRAVRAERGVRLSSAEVYLTSGTTRLANSRGASGQVDETLVDLEFVLLAGEGVEGTEAYKSLSRRRLADLGVERAVASAAKVARDSQQATAPSSGATAIVFSEDALGTGAISDFWDPFRFHSSAQAAYRKLARFSPGKLVTGGRIAGEPLALATNPTASYGTASTPFDADGVALRRLSLVEDGRLVRYWATKEYADYLRIEPTGPITNVELPAGETAEADLLRDGASLQVVSFSWFNPDALTGDFATEIRLGYERRRGKERPVKGGAVQGNLFDAFRRATFSRETAWVGAYHGPRSIRCERITVGGT
jgi:predicted Zn-dependent protease